MDYRDDLTKRLQDSIRWDLIDGTGAVWHTDIAYDCAEYYLKHYQARRYKHWESLKLVPTPKKEK